MAEPIFREFEDYPWDTDEAFQQGLEQVLKNVTPQDPLSKDELLLRAKVFFFHKATNKTIDIDEYKKWAEPEGIHVEGEVPRSYEEIVELILSGKPIPGIKQIPNDVLGQEASSPSTAPQRKKPWEK